VDVFNYRCYWIQVGDDGHFGVLIFRINSSQILFSPHLISSRTGYCVENSVELFRNVYRGQLLELKSLKQVWTRLYVSFLKHFSFFSAKKKELLYVRNKHPTIDGLTMNHKIFCHFFFVFFLLYFLSKDKIKRMFRIFGLLMF